MNHSKMANIMDRNQKLKLLTVWCLNRVFVCLRVITAMPETTAFSFARMLLHFVVTSFIISLIMKLIWEMNHPKRSLLFYTWYYEKTILALIALAFLLTLTINTFLA